MTWTKEQHNRYCSDRWKQRKLWAIEYKGGKCQCCGYNSCPDVLEFHHVNPTEKDANWNKIRLWSQSRMKSELDKCVLLCANCHREEHFIARCLSSAG